MEEEEAPSPLSTNHHHPSLQSASKFPKKKKVNKSGDHKDKPLGVTKPPQKKNSRNPALCLIKPHSTIMGMFAIQQTNGDVLCCKCGISMPPNAANTCLRCLQAEFDITQGMQKHVIILWCPECQSYLESPQTWIKAELGSKELLLICLKRLKNINKFHWLLAEFVPTEPHSKKIKVKLTVKKEVHIGVVLEQAYIVEYDQMDHMCEVCFMVHANPNQWVASVQLRQNVAHSRTFLRLEQLILKFGAARIRVIKINRMHKGMDFFFAKKRHALKFMEFIGAILPIKSRSDKQLVSHDIDNNSYNYKDTFSVKICPICLDDLICLPPEVAVSLGNLGPLVLCAKVRNNLLLLDPFTLRHAFMDADQYWKAKFRPLLSSEQLVEYIVLNVEPGGSEVLVAGSKYVLANVQVARLSDFGKNDNKFIIQTHLGHLLNPGDSALGYDLCGATVNGIELDQYKSLVIPDAILVKKSYEKKHQKKCAKHQLWQLKVMEIEVNTSSRKIEDDKMNAEYEGFLKDLEENPELRFNVSLHTNKEDQPSAMASVTDGEDAPSVPLDELLADLDLSDEEDDEANMRD